jgi:Beta-lactamase enzyme family
MTDGSAEGKTVTPHVPHAGRVLAGVAVALVAVLVLVLLLRGHGGGDRAGAAEATKTPGPAQSTAPAQALPGSFQADPADAAAAGEAPAPPHANPLAAAAASYVAGRAGTVLAAVYDVRTGQTWQLGDGPVQAEASVVKLDILETLLAQQGGAALSPGDQALVRAMIEDSDNDAATSLWDEDGGAAGLTYYDDRAGLTRTTPSPCVACAGFAWPGWGLSTTVPEDQLTLLKQLIVPGPNALLSGAARSYALSLMEHVAPDQAWGVSGGVPAGVTVALKDGWLPLDDANTDWQVNSVGWVSGDGRDYLIAVLSTGNPTEQYGIDTISGLSSLVWTAMR